jgi:aspartokinase/homoserine dehydrogenase 1
VAVDAGEEELAISGLKEAFAIEIARDSELSVSSKSDCSIVAIIGEGMKERTGISARFFNALGRAKVNVVAIAQGASERNVSVVVSKKDLSRALRAVHSGFTLSEMNIAVGVIGTGLIGTEVMKQVAKFQASAGERLKLPAMAQVSGLNIEMRAVADQTRMVLAEHGLPLNSLAAEGAHSPSDWEKMAKDEGISMQEKLLKAWDGNKEGDIQVLESNMDTLEEYLDTKRIPHKVIIDCTDSDDIASKYADWMNKGIHVISTSKRCGAGPLDRWLETLQAEGQWHYETSVGAQMPIISTIHDLIQTGDEVKRVEGVLSGTIGLILDSMSQDSSLSMGQALLKASEYGLTEPDPRDDVCGLDAARKALIIARELGLQFDISDVTVESLLPEGDCPKDVEGIAKALDGDQNTAVRAKLQEAADKGECLRYVCEVDVQKKTASVALRSCPPRSPLASSTGADNVVYFVTERYPDTSPLVVRGPGAGAVVTASGVLAELLRLSKQLSN